MWCRGHHSFADAFLYRSACFVVQTKLDVLKTTIMTLSLGNRRLIDDTAAWGPFGNSLRVFERVGHWEQDEHLVCSRGQRWVRRPSFTNIVFDRTTDFVDLAQLGTKMRTTMRFPVESWMEGCYGHLWAVGRYDICFLPL